eukprot:6359979-Prymnesium_polylepis.1
MASRIAAADTPTGNRIRPHLGCSWAPSRSRCRFGDSLSDSGADLPTRLAINVRLLAVSRTKSMIACKRIGVLTKKNSSRIWNGQRLPDRLPPREGSKRK